jgi:hypothetical protein
MQRHYDTLLEEQRGPYTVIVDKTWEDLHPNDCFDESVTDIKEICEKIDRCELDWFMLRVRILFDGYELAADYVGGFLYEDAREVLTDGTAEDMISCALDQAKESAAQLFQKLQQLEKAMA